jgi:hypothetical protein
MISEVKNDCAHVSALAHVIMQDICNKVIETKKKCRMHGLVVMLTIPRSKVHLTIPIVVYLDELVENSFPKLFLEQN